MKELTDKALAIGKVEPDAEKIKDEAELAQATEIFEKLGAIKDAMSAAIEEENAAKDWGDGEPPEVDRDALEVRVPDDIIYKLMG